MVGVENIGSDIELRNELDINFLCFCIIGRMVITDTPILQDVHDRIKD